VARLKNLERENVRLKQLLAEKELENTYEMDRLKGVRTGAHNYAIFGVLSTEGRRTSS
jgi:hypothetical protein